MIDRNFLNTYIKISCATCLSGTIAGAILSFEPSDKCLTENFCSQDFLLNLLNNFTYNFVPLFSIYKILKLILNWN